MKPSVILNYVLSTAVVVLLFYIRTSADSTETPPPEPSAPGCNYAATTGFSAARTISRPEALATTKEYKKVASISGDNIFGGVISKAVLDSLFCSGNFNGLAYSFAKDPNGGILPKVSTFIVVSGVTIQYNQNGDPEITSQSTNNYLANTWCPPNCVNFN
jgi:hypothetical protein